MDIGRHVRVHGGMANGIQSILAPVDFSPCSEAALATALSWAHRLDAQVEVLHVWNLPAYVSQEMMVELDAKQGKQVLLDVMHQEGERQMNAMIGRLPAADLPRVKAVVRAGEPLAAILEHAEAHSLVIMGTHGRKGLEHFILGSLAERVVRNANRPVLVIGAGTKVDAPKRILVPVDFSGHARLAMAQAMSLAKDVGASVMALHVINRIPSLQGFERLMVGYAGDSKAAYEHLAITKANDELAAFLGGIPGHGASSEVLLGDPVKTILEVAEAGGYDLIVIGRKGRTVLGVDLGSTALKVLRATKLPVLAVHDSTPEEPLEEDE